MTQTLDTRARVLLLVLLFVLAASVAAFMAYRGLHGSSDDSSTAAPQPTHTPKAQASVGHSATKPKPPATSRRGAAVTRSQAAPAAAQAKAKPAASPNQLPAPIRRALAAHRVVVVALYDPKATIDGAALAEARAGAKLGGVKFVPIDVRSRAVDSLNARYGAVHDPAVLVLRPPDSVVVRIDGFADRDTVAQAALNATS